MHRWQTIKMCVLVLSSVGAAGADPALEYQVVYSGILSGGASLRIADVRLDSRKAGGAQGLLETRLEVSSEAYPTIERLFPIRYRFRNWAAARDFAHLRGFETYQRTRRHRHRLYLPDDSEIGVRRYDLLRGEGTKQIAQLEAGSVPGSTAPDGRFLDRLGMLQRLRWRPMQEHGEYLYDVTNGREWLRYRVRVEAAQMLSLNGRSVPAWRLRFDGEERDRRGGWKAAHRPLYLWLSQAPQKIPLRIDARHAIGLFRIELKNAAAVGLLAHAGG